MRARSRSDALVQVCLRNHSNRFWGYIGLVVVEAIVLVADRSHSAFDVTFWNVGGLMLCPWIVLTAIRPRLLVDAQGLTVVNIWRTVRVPKSAIADIQSDFRYLRIVRAGALPAVDVWAVQTAQFTRYIGRNGFSDTVADLLRAALRTSSLDSLQPIATPQPLDARPVLGVAVGVLVLSLGIRLAVGV